MALTGESETYRHEMNIARISFLPGPEFAVFLEAPINLMPRRCGDKWRVPVITAWTVDVDFDAQSDEGYEIIAGGGECMRRFFLRPGQDAFHQPVSGTAFNNDFIMELSESNNWYPSATPQQLPQWQTVYSDLAQAVWIVRRTNIGFWSKQTHTVPLTSTGYWAPDGEVRYSFTYHWRTLSNVEFEARRARI